MLIKFKIILMKTQVNEILMSSLALFNPLNHETITLLILSDKVANDNIVKT